MTAFAKIKFGSIRLAITGVVLLAGLAGATPAAACLRQIVVEFEPGAVAIVNSGAITEFVQVSSYGSRQKLDVRVEAPEHELAVRRVNALLDLLQSHGLDRNWIRTRASRGDQDRAVLLNWPGPVAPPRNVAIAQTAPPRATCGG
jgi:hypothetical protein